MDLFNPVAPIIVAITALSFRLIAQTPDPSVLAPYVDSGALLAVVGALIWVMKRVGSGEMVARPVVEIAEREASRNDAYKALVSEIRMESHREVEKLKELIEEGKEREELLRQILIHKLGLEGR